ncbi:unnamed protein product [Urochloa decumbens]|uniref:Uncharacterized protein n=1 Tax=Urochloa decumbens TaxID=240449 RepID=A0ABC9DVG1_9POAL
MDGRSALAKIGFAVLASNSALAIRNSRGDAASVAFVLAVDAGLALLFVCLREFERVRGGGRNIKAAVWALTTLLTAMFAWKVAASPMPPAVAGVVWVMGVERARSGARDNNMARAHTALARVGLAVLACNAALDAYDGRRDDTVSSALAVLVCFSGLVILTGLFVRAFAHAHGGGHGQGY